MSRASRARTETTQADPISVEAGAAARVSEIKHRLNTLEARNAELIESQHRIERERSEVVAAIEQAEAELEAMVAAPVAGGEDPTLWLPDELLVLILVRVVAFYSWSCTRVCRRWRRLCQGRSVTHGLWNTRWGLYAKEELKPRNIPTGFHGFLSLAAGNGKVYCSARAFCAGLIEVRSDKDGALLQTLRGHTASVTALAVGLDGTLYSGSNDDTIRVWSGETGARIRTLTGHRRAVDALVVNETHLFSSAEDGTIRAWQCSTGNCVHVFKDVGGWVLALALGNHDQLYSGSEEGELRVWSTTDYTLLRILDFDSGSALAVAKNGNLFSGGRTIRVWSGTDGALLQTLREGHTGWVTSMVCAPNGMMFSGSCDGAIQMWLGGKPTSHGQVVSSGEKYPQLVFTRSGHLWVAGFDNSSIQIY